MRPLLSLLLAAPVILAWACATTGGSGGGEAAAGPVRITFRQFRNDVVFELVNEAHTSRVELYSEVRTTAERKVTTDEVADELLRHFADLHWARHAVPGPAPQSVPAGLFTLEVDRNGRVEHVIEVQGAGADVRQDLRLMIQAFLNIYNATWGAQAVEVAPGENPFQRPRR